MSIRRFFTGFLLCFSTVSAFSQVVTKEFNLLSSHRELQDGDVDPTICPNPPDDCHCKSTNSWDAGYNGPFKEGSYVGRNSTGWPQEFMNWRMVFPTGYDLNRAEPYPMIIMLHGAGEGGRKSNCCGFDYAPSNPLYDNNGKNIALGGQVHLAAVQRNSSLSNSFPGIVIWPQSSYNGAWESGWENGNQSDNSRMASEIIQYMIREKNVDPDRIAMHGLSNGAAGVWDLASKRPDLFSTITPMSGVGSNQAVQIESLVTTPIWIFQGAVDTNPVPAASLDWTNAMITAGGTMQRTLYPAPTGHGTWDKAYAEPDFFPWIKRANKKDIYVFGGVAKVCQGGQLRIAISANYAEYVWTKGGVDIPNSNNRNYYVTTPGEYAVRYRRRDGAFRPNHPNPQYGQWGQSNPVTVGDAGVSTYVPPLTNTGSVNLTIDKSGIDNRIRFTAPAGNSQYTWFKNSVQIPYNAVNGPDPNKNFYEISSNSGAAADAGTYTMRLVEPTGCTSLISNPITVYFNSSQPTTPKPVAPTMTLVNGNEANLTWTDYSGEVAYEVWRTRYAISGTPNYWAGSVCTTPPGKYAGQNFQLIKVLPANTTSYHDIGLRWGQAQYRYVIRAVLSSGQAIFGPEPNSQLVTSPDVQPPTNPGNLTASAITGTTATLSWVASSDNDFIYGYEVFNGSTSVAFMKATSNTYVPCQFITSTEKTLEGTVEPPLTYSITGLEANTTYNFSVRALDWMGNYSSFSDPVTVTTPLAIASSTGLDYKFFTYPTGTAPSLISYDFDQKPQWVGVATNFPNLTPTGVSPTPGTRFVLEWEGFLDIRTNEGTGDYTFYAASNASLANPQPSMIYIDNDGTGYKLVVNNPGTNNQELNGTINLPAVAKYPFKVVYANSAGTKSLTINWKPPLLSKQGISTGRLFRYDKSYYYLKIGNAGNDPTVVTAWTTAYNGNGGTTLANFTTANRYYVFANRGSSTIGSNWTITGAASRIVVGNGYTPIDVTFNNPVTARVEADAGGIININNALMPTFGVLDPESTVNFTLADSTSIPVGVYGNVNLTQPEGYKLAKNITQVQGNLDVVDGAVTIGAENNFSTLKVGGDVAFHNSVGSPLPASSSTTYALAFGGGKNHTVSFDNPVDPNFFSIRTDAGDSVTFDNAGTHTYSVGTTQGGGLANRGTIILGANNLVVSGRGTINTNGETGDIAINGGNFTLNSTASTASTIYFNSTDHTVNNLSVTLPSSYGASIQSPINISNLVSLSGGNITSGGDGYLTLMSSGEASTARIGPLTGTSRISGPITTQRYMEGEGTIYRYLSMPVKGVKISDLQAFFPVTGDFTGHDVIPGMISGPSLNYYNEPGGGYKQWPPVGGTNQDTLRTGVGYATYIREGTLPTNWQVKGAPNQGTITYSLTGGTTPSTGYNLVGNPYPAPIKWNGATGNGWTMTGVNNTISVRENHSDGSYSFKTWNGTTGSLTGGLVTIGQAYWVQTTIASPTLVLTETAKSITDGAFYREGDPENVMAIKMKQGTREDDTYIQFAREATPAFDKNLDGLKLSNSFFNLSTLTSDGKSLAINMTTTGQCDQTISFRMTNTTAGSYQLILSGVGSLLAGDKVVFTDAFTNATINLTDEYTHTFSITPDAASKADGRFKLKFIKPALAATDNTLASDAACNSSNPVVLVNNSQAGVDYTAFVNGIAVSTPVVGNGGNLFVPIDHSKIPFGKTNIQFKAGFMGCTQSDLSNTVNVNRDTVALPNVIMNQGVLSVSNATGVTYKWFHGEEELGVTTPDFTPIDSGAYTVEISKASCVLTSNQVVKNALHLNNALTSDEVCNADAVITINNTQEGAKYRAYFGSIEASEFITGTGGPISVPLYSSVINSGQKDISIQAGFDNDLPQFLTSQVTVTRDVLTTPNVVVDGTKLKSTATGSGYKWYLNDQLIDGADENEINFVSEGSYSVEVISGTCDVKSDNIPLSFTIRTDLTLQSQAVCDSDATVNINNSQAGVTYGAYYNNTLVSNEMIGNGENIDLTVSSSLGSGKKDLIIKAGYLNNTKHDLQGLVTVDREGLAIPQVTVVAGILKADVQNVSYEWFRDGEKINGQISSAIDPSGSGTYYVVVSNGICSKQSAPVDYIVTGLGELDETTVTLSPNPAKTRVLIVAGKAIQPAAIRLTSTLGQSFRVPVSPITDRSVELDVSELSTGFYLVHLNGQVIRLVKE